jgi:hypothetical protein
MRHLTGNSVASEYELPCLLRRLFSLDHLSKEQLKNVLQHLCQAMTVNNLNLILESDSWGDSWRHGHKILMW